MTSLKFDDCFHSPRSLWMSTSRSLHYTRVAIRASYIPHLRSVMVQAWLIVEPSRKVSKLMTQDEHHSKASIITLLFVHVCAISPSLQVLGYLLHCSVKLDTLRLCSTLKITNTVKGTNKLVTRGDICHHETHSQSLF